MEYKHSYFNEVGLFEMFENSRFMEFIFLEMKDGVSNFF